MGIAGACRRDELIKMKIDDIECKESLLIVCIPDSKTNQSRKFTIINDTAENAIDYVGYYKKYIHLREQCKNNLGRRLFFRYSKGRCTNQVIGMNTIGKIPSDIAKYLNLSNPNLYTGHCFRRTSATLLVHGGGDLIQLKKHGGWKSSNVAEGYIDDSMTNKIQTFQRISGQSQTQKKSDLTFPEICNTSDPSTSGINIKSCKNCTFNFNIVNNKK